MVGSATNSKPEDRKSGSPLSAGRLRLSNKNTERLGYFGLTAPAEHQKHRSDGLPVTRENQKHQRHRSIELPVTNSTKNIENANRLGCWSPQSTNNTDRLGFRLPKSIENNESTDELGCRLPESPKTYKKALSGLAVGHQKTAETQKHKKHSRNLWSVGCPAST